MEEVNTLGGRYVREAKVAVNTSIWCLSDGSQIGVRFGVGSGKILPEM